jgi:3-hydroxyisobutyrate dehydrogenase
MHVAFLGTGLMGRPMAERLLAAHHQVSVYNRTRDKAMPLAAAGARVAASAAEAVAGAECVIVMVRDAAAVRALLFPAGGSAAAPPVLTGRTVVQMSTIAPAESAALLDEVRRAGGEYLEAAVLGSTPQAREGKLVVLAGGTPEQFDRWAELLRHFGPEPQRVGEVGQAMALKLALNQLIASLAAAFSLSLGMVRRRGIDPELFMRVLRASALYAPTFDARLPRMLARDFADALFPAELLLKDIDLVRSEAAALGLDGTAVDGVRDVLARAVEQGMGRLDYAALYEIVDPAPAPRP